MANRCSDCSMVMGPPWFAVVGGAVCANAGAIDTPTIATPKNILPVQTMLCLTLRSSRLLRRKADVERRRFAGLNRNVARVGCVSGFANLHPMTACGQLHRQPLARRRRIPFFSVDRDVGVTRLHT